MSTATEATWRKRVDGWIASGQTCKEYAALLQRRVLRYADFPCASALPRAVTGFIRRWNRDEAHPFNWTFRGHFVHTQRHHAA